MSITQLAEPVNTVSFHKDQMPVINFAHIRNLTDDTGIIQHAIFSTPNRKEGYCIDDNSRALLLSVLAHKAELPKADLPNLAVYLSYVHYMQTKAGEFKNFMDYTKVAVEDRGSEDSFGRTIMALGYLINEGPASLLIKTGVGIFNKALPHIDRLVSIRGMANSIIGVCQFIRFNYPDDTKASLVTRLSNKMMQMYQENKKQNWHWFEPVLTYDNAILPLALLNAYEITGNEDYLSVGLRSMSFLESKVFHDNIVSPIGNDGWFPRGGVAARFDQQGIDIMAMVLLYEQAFHITGDTIYQTRMYQSFQWFLGKNDLGVLLYDPSTGGCADGLHSEGINQNQGAESTIAYWISHLIVTAALKK